MRWPLYRYREVRGEGAARWIWCDSIIYDMVGRVWKSDTRFLELRKCWFLGAGGGGSILNAKFFVKFLCKFPFSLETRKKNWCGVPLCFVLGFLKASSMSTYSSSRVFCIEKYRLENFAATWCQRVYTEKNTYRSTFVASVQEKMFFYRLVCEWWVCQRKGMSRMSSQWRPPGASSSVSGDFLAIFRKTAFLWNTKDERMKKGLRKNARGEETRSTYFIERWVQKMCIYIAVLLDSRSIFRPWILLLNRHFLHRKISSSMFGVVMNIAGKCKQTRAAIPDSNLCRVVMMLKFSIENGRI